MEKLTQKNHRRLRHCEVVIWRVLHKKAGLDYGDYSRQWQSWFDDWATDLGEILDQVLHDDAGNLRLKKGDYRKFWTYGCELRDLRRKGEDHLEKETVKKLLLK